MEMNAGVYEDAFNMLCGRKLGEGIHRQVFECKILPHLVVKVENDLYRYFANVYEQRVWSDNEYCEKVARWLAPVAFMSPDAKVLLQYRTDPLPQNYSLPDRVPTFLTDLKRENFGIFEGRLVCHDYAMTVSNLSTRLTKAHW